MTSKNPLFRAIERALRSVEQIGNICSAQQLGTGLGLSINEIIAKLHGGTLMIKSNASIGTIMTINLPARRLLPARHTEDMKEAV
jgi:signal transduction histidine kinase